MAKSMKALALLALLPACAHAPAEPSFDPRALFDDAAFARAAPLPEPRDLFALEKEDALRLRAAIEERALHTESRRLALVSYLEEMLADFTYGDRTATARDVLARRRGNCLGLALLAAAIARELGVPYVFQEVLAPPTFDRRNGMMLVNRHVNVWVFDPEDPASARGADLHHIALAQTASVVDFFPMSRTYPTRYLDDADVIAMFYGNLAAEALLEGDEDRAYAALRRALDMDIDFADGWNVLGLVYGRRGNPRAEKAYRHALDLAPDDLTTANNLSIWLEREGRREEAARWRARADGARAGNPFGDYDRGESALERGDYRSAARLFRRAAEIDPFQHEFQFGLFKAYWMQGDRDRALRALREAIRIAEDGEVVAQYNRKLTALMENPAP